MPPSHLKQKEKKDYNEKYREWPYVQYTIQFTRVFFNLIKDTEFIYDNQNTYLQ